MAIAFVWCSIVYKVTWVDWQTKTEVSLRLKQADALALVKLLLSSVKPDSIIIVPTV